MLDKILIVIQCFTILLVFALYVYLFRLVLFGVGEVMK